MNELVLLAEVVPIFVAGLPKDLELMRIPMLCENFLQVVFAIRKVSVVLHCARLANKDAVVDHEVTCFVFHTI